MKRISENGKLVPRVLGRAARRAQKTSPNSFKTLFRDWLRLDSVGSFLDLGYTRLTSRYRDLVPVTLNALRRRRLAFEGLEHRQVLAGDLDLSFGGVGYVTTPIGNGADAGYGLVVQPDGKAVVGGYSHNGNNYDFALVRYNVNGTLDTTFDGDGKVTTPIGSGDDYGWAVALQSDGKILLGGFSFNGSNEDLALVRYNSNGSLDTSFGTGGKVLTAVGTGRDEIRGIAIQPDGKIVVSVSRQVPAATLS